MAFEEDYGEVLERTIFQQKTNIPKSAYGTSSAKYGQVSETGKVEKTPSQLAKEAKERVSSSRKSSRRSSGKSSRRSSRISQKQSRAPRLIKLEIGGQTYYQDVDKGYLEGGLFREESPFTTPEGIIVGTVTESQSTKKGGAVFSPELAKVKQQALMSLNKEKEVFQEALSKLKSGQIEGINLTPELMEKFKIPITFGGKGALMGEEAIKVIESYLNNDWRKNKEKIENIETTYIPEYEVTSTKLTPSRFATEEDFKKFIQKNPQYGFRLPDKSDEEVRQALIKARKIAGGEDPVSQMTYVPHSEMVVMPSGEIKYLRPDDPYIQQYKTQLEVELESARNQRSQQEQNLINQKMKELSKGKNLSPLTELALEKAIQYEIDRERERKKFEEQTKGMTPLQKLSYQSMNMIYGGHQKERNQFLKRVVGVVGGVNLATTDPNKLLTPAQRDLARRVQSHIGGKAGAYIQSIGEKIEKGGQVVTGFWQPTTFVGKTAKSTLTSLPAMPFYIVADIPAYPSYFYELTVRDPRQSYRVLDEVVPTYRTSIMKDPASALGYLASGMLIGVVGNKIIKKTGKHLEKISKESGKVATQLDIQTRYKGEIFDDFAKIKSKSKGKGVIMVTDKFGKHNYPIQKIDVNMVVENQRIKLPKNLRKKLVNEVAETGSIGDITLRKMAKFVKENPAFEGIRGQGHIQGKFTVELPNGKLVDVEIPMKGIDFDVADRVVASYGLRRDQRELGLGGKISEIYSKMQKSNLRQKGISASKLIKATDVDVFGRKITDIAGKQITILRKQNADAIAKINEQFSGRFSKGVLGDVESALRKIRRRPSSSISSRLQNSMDNIKSKLQNYYNRMPQDEWFARTKMKQNIAKSSDFRKTLKILETLDDTKKAGYTPEISQARQLLGKLKNKKRWTDADYNAYFRIENELSNPFPFPREIIQNLEQTGLKMRAKQVSSRYKKIMTTMNQYLRRASVLGGTTPSTPKIQKTKKLSKRQPTRRPSFKATSRPLRSPSGHLDELKKIQKNLATTLYSARKIQRSQARKIKQRNEEELKKIQEIRQMEQTRQKQERLKEEIPKISGAPIQPKGVSYPFLPFPYLLNFYDYFRPPIPTGAYRDKRSRKKLFQTLGYANEYEQIIKMLNKMWGGSK